MTTRFLSKAVAGVLAAGMLAIPGCIPQALAADPTRGMISTAISLEEEYDLPSGLLLSVAEVESDFNPDCRTGKCWGLMQIHSSYSKEYAALAGLEDYNLFDYADSMRIAAAMLDSYIDKYEGDLHYSLMCYNLGEAGAKAKRKDGVQTTGYSRKVISKMDKYSCYGVVVEVPVKDTAPEEKPEPEDLIEEIRAILTGAMQKAWEVLVR